MNIHAKRGAKVRFTKPTAGYPADQAAARILTQNKVYTVDRVVMDDWHTSVWLQEIPAVSFNSVLFEDADLPEQPVAGDGVRVYDPRDQTMKVSANPALVLADMLKRQVVPNSVRIDDRFWQVVGALADGVDGVQASEAQAGASRA